MIILANARAKVCTHAIYLLLTGANLLSLKFRIAILAIDSMRIYFDSNISTDHTDLNGIVYNIFSLLKFTVEYRIAFHNTY